MVLCFALNQIYNMFDPKEEVAAFYTLYEEIYCDKNFSAKYVVKCTAIKQSEKSLSEK